MIVRNRIALAIASLIWLVWRSGTKPSRLSYPCQQAAAANLGFLAVLFIPGLSKWRERGGAGRRAYATVVASVSLAGVLFILISGGVAVYSNYSEPGIDEIRSALPTHPGVPTRTSVGIAQDDDLTITDADVEALVRQAVMRAGGLAEVITVGDSVVLKPNLVQDGWDATQGVTTDPRVMAAIVQLCWEAGAGSVTIAEGTAAELGGDGPRGVTWDAYHDSRYDVNRDRLFDYDPNVALVDLNDAGGLNQTDPNKVTPVTLPNGVIRTQYFVPNILLESDVLICVPTLKNHYNGTVTLGLKNRVGTAPNDIYHRPGWTNMKWGLVHSIVDGFPRNVIGPDVPPEPVNENQVVQYTTVDLNLVRPNDYVIVDGLIGVMNGPNDIPILNPNPRMRMIVAGPDTVAVDAVGSLIMGYDPTLIPSIAWADNRTVLGTMNTAYINVMGDHVAAVRYDFPTDHGVGAERAESVSPVLTDISLKDGDTVAGIATISGWGISDNVAVAKAELVVDGEVVDVVVDPPDPFYLTWDTAGWVPGEYEAVVYVYDAALNEAGIARTVQVGPTQEPYIELNTAYIDHTTFVCEYPPDDAFTVGNLGQATLNYTIEVDQPWLILDQTSGTLATGATDTITVSYDISAGGDRILMPGLHEGTITITDPNAVNDPQTIPVSVTIETVPPDVDRDGDVDQSDFGIIQMCMAGSGVPIPPDPICQMTDFDVDGDVDLEDGNHFKQCQSGANVCPDPNCMTEP